jgi:YjbE family integral membrane protein
MLELLRAVGSILLVDIVLSGDNALVIGAAAAGLEQGQQRAAILAGGAGAMVLRIVFALLASFLLLLPGLQAIGGVILLFIAIRLLMGRGQKADSAQSKQARESSEPGKQRKGSRGFFAALLTILLADVTMSLDNVLAVGALAHGDLLALTLGILLSVALLMIGSTLVARIIRWLPWLLDIAALVLAWTGADMILRDQRLGDLLNNYSWTSIALPVAFPGIVLLADALFRLHAQKQARLSQ